MAYAHLYELSCELCNGQKLLICVIIVFTSYFGFWFFFVCISTTVLFVLVIISLTSILTWFRK